MSVLAVAKLGGSLAASEILPRLLRALDGRPHLVVAPGGGPFADAVRRAQVRLGFDDAAAHDKALLAMARYGRLLAARAGWRAARGADALAAQMARRTDRGPLVWLPDPARDALEVERSWRISGDSLALWLARRLGARRLVLLKSCAIPTHDLAALAAAGIVDAALPELAARAPRVDIRLVDASTGGDGLEALLGLARDGGEQQAGPPWQTARPPRQDSRAVSRAISV
ncbi:MAG TPA: hypothetical protein PKC23_01310 [Candidatus Desulfobacillus sp.]|nr:hypothetical protein [Candidatus Desulfobacillus sp.]